MNMAREQQPESGRLAHLCNQIRQVASGVSALILMNPGIVWGTGLQDQMAAAEQPSMILMGLKMMGALCLIIGLLFLSLHVLKRWRPGIARCSADSQIRILDVRMLAQKQSVALVEVDGEKLLLGVGTDTVALLSRIGCSPHAGIDRDGECHQSGSDFESNLTHAISRQPVQEGKASRGPGDTANKELTILK